MTVGMYTVVSGTVTTEQDFITVMDNVMVQVFGWELVAKISDTSTNRHYAWRSQGEQPGKYMTLYTGLRGQSNNVQISGYTHVSQAGAVSDELHDNTQSLITWSNIRDWWALGNKDAVYFFARDSTNSHRTGGFGYFNTYYTEFKQDPYPVFVLGQSGASSIFHQTDRVFMYATRHDAVAAGGGVAGGHFLGTLSSGIIDGYRALDLSTYTQLNAPGLRDNKHAALRPVFYINETTSMFNNEVRGELPGTYNIWGNGFLIGDKVTASGLVNFDGSPGNDQEFIITNEFGQNDNTYLLGPVLEFNPVPYSISNMVLWLQGGVGIERTGAAFSRGTVSNWRDFSSTPNLETPNRNDASQPTTGSQPVSIPAVLNNNDVVLFRSGGTDNLTGTVDITNDMTVFAVSSYSTSANRSPIFFARGAVSSNDTYLVLEYNPNVNDSVEFTFRSDDSVLAEDTERVTSLTSNTYKILSATVSGNTSTLWVNGFAGNSTTISDTKGSVPGTTNLNYAIGATLNSSGAVDGVSYHEGNIAEVLVYGKTLTNEERESVECYLSKKYNITVSGTCT